MTDTPWISKGLCVGANNDLWFGNGDLTLDQNNALYKRAYRICEECPVSRPCYELAAIKNEAHGIWGGIPFGGKSNRVYVLRRLTRMQEIWAARGEPTHPVGKFANADRWFDPAQRDALILPMPVARTTHTPQLTIEDRRRQAAAEAAS